jgi:hypothetical protein
LIGRAVVLAAVLVVPLLPVDTREARACTCIGTDALVADGLSFSDAVFSGTVTDVHQPRFIRVLVATFRADRIWKGPGDRVRRVWTDASLCGAEFQEGEAYLVFAHGAQGNPRTSMCGILRLQTADEASAYLSGGVPPTNGAVLPVLGDHRATRTLAAIGMLALAALATVVVRWMVSRGREY